jgi:hypothetical protein
LKLQMSAALMMLAVRPDDEKAPPWGQGGAPVMEVVDALRPPSGQERLCGRQQFFLGFRLVKRRVPAWSPSVIVRMLVVAAYFPPAAKARSIGTDWRPASFSPPARLLAPVAPDLL